MAVDSFKYLSRLISRYYRLSRVAAMGPIPWSPLQKGINESRFALVTSGGLYQRGIDPPFDVAREKRQPDWGDPSYRLLPTDMAQADLGVSHLHINEAPLLADMNILLPIARFRELVAKGEVDSLADHAYSFMGYQGFPADVSGWRTKSGPEVAARMADEGVECVLLTAA